MAADYVIRALNSPRAVNAEAWDTLLRSQPDPSPFMRHAYLLALHESGSACEQTGWSPRFFTLEANGCLSAACVLYIKSHSYGEYVFDWSWANSYAQNGIPYYPKALVAVPFTPVPGGRLLARSAAARTALVKALVQWCDQRGLSSLHLLFLQEQDVTACREAGLLLRHNVQFHWENQGTPSAAGLAAVSTTYDASAPNPTDLGAKKTRQATQFRDFDDFLRSLTQEKRKKIRQERRKVQEAGVTFRWAAGQDIASSDWDFFYRCYERTYLEHGNAPYLTRNFFECMADNMPENWLLFTAMRGAQPIASSLIAIDSASTSTGELNATSTDTKIAYGRYWGALERVDCLHFEACYYQPLEWCIAHGYQRFEGGAQGEHKMARALLPVKTTSCHWLAHAAFAEAVERFLEREDRGIGNYLDHLMQRSPFRERE
ncbi:MAG: GNAT family N-acetyltransferase [Rhodoferax sp.]|nr:GNAT family N-acetyltransferase [Rhodoferax sp.]